MAQLVTRGRVAALTVLCTLWSRGAAAQQRDTTASPRPDDRLKVYTLPPAVVFVASVVINAVNGRYYEPAPGRNMYVGFSLGAGE